MKIAIIGTGYVGLVSGTCFAEMGIKVTCVDRHPEKIESLNKGISTIYEPSLERLIKKNLKNGNLTFTTSLQEAILDVSIVFIAVGTPPLPNGEADMSAVEGVAREVARCANNYFLLVTKSTVPVGTSMHLRNIVLGELMERGLDLEFDIASNPEFLKEGAAVKDFLEPDRIVVGIESSRAKTLIRRLYRPFTENGRRIIFMDIASSELTKYAANCMLATRISFINEIANLCEVVGADIECVRKGIGSDPRIGEHFLNAGVGYGGSCFPKDIGALLATAKEYGRPLQIIEAVQSVNHHQRKVLFGKLREKLGTLEGKIIAVWGLAFKADTDDIRESPSMDLIYDLLDAGALVRVTDPQAMDNARELLEDGVEYCDDKYSAATGADAVVLVTPWRDYRFVDWGHLNAIMQGNLLLDGRNIYSPEELEEFNFDYHPIGRSASLCGLPFGS